MFDRFRRRPDGAGAASTAVLERERVADDERARADEVTRADDGQRLERDRAVAPDPQWETAREQRTMAPLVERDTMRDRRARQRDRFGGIHWGSAFFGLLCAVGLASILTAILAAAGVALGLSDVKNAVNASNVGTIGVGGGILLLVAVAIAWYCGGYVAGRMSRFDGIRQGVAVWLWTILLGAAVAVAAAIGGSQYNLFERLNLPNVPVDSGSLTTKGAIALGAALVATLLAAIVGAKVGERYHRRVDRVAVDEYVQERATA
jgi:hypothetical protein